MYQKSSGACCCDVRLYRHEFPGVLEPGLVRHVRVRACVHGCSRQVVVDSWPSPYVLRI